jgi:hypothetical protein
MRGADAGRFGAARRRHVHRAPRLQRRAFTPCSSVTVSQLYLSTAGGGVGGV